MVTVELICEDGTPFPVVFGSAEDAASTWVLEREHSIGPSTPLAAALSRIGRPGGERAYGESGLPFPSSWQHSPDALGFSYFRSGPPDAEEMAAMFSGCTALVERYGSALGLWRDYGLPRVRQTCAWLDSADGMPVSLLAEQHDYAFHHTMISAMVTWNDLRQMVEVCTGLYGAEAELVAFELSQGYENDTVRANQRLWELGQAALRHPDVGDALTSDDPGGALDRLRAGGGASDFFSTLDAFLSEFGRRCETWSIDSPTWDEQGPGLWAQVRQMARPDVTGPAEILRRAGERRRQLVDEIDAKLSEDEALQARFHRRVGRLADYVVVREERANWQLIADGSLRHALLRRGAALVDTGVLATPEDVLFLLPDEVDEPPAAVGSLVAERRQEHARRRRLQPPTTIGAGPAALAPSGPGVLARGVGGCRGAATGPARVLRDLSDADRLQPGDVLVCPMTAPPWTPLFAVAAAVVVDTGQLGSHPAIAAREYGIPCVLSTGDGTSAIPDGAAVTVDGTAGTVTLVDERR